MFRTVANRLMNVMQSFNCPFLLYTNGIQFFLAILLQFIWTVQTWLSYAFAWDLLEENLPSKFYLEYGYLHISILPLFEVH